MKRLTMVMMAVVLVVAGMAQAYMLDDFEDGSQNWAVNGPTGGSLSSIANSTEAPYFGSRSLKFVDTDSGHPHVYSAESHGDQTALKTTYVEIALKGVNLSNGVLGNNGVDIYFGTDGSNRENWRIPEADFQAGTAKPGGWWILHLALDADGHSTLTGTTLNGVALTGTAKAAWTSGTVDWANIGYVAVLISEGSGSDVGTYYLDQVALGEPVAVPEGTMLDDFEDGAQNWVVRGVSGGSLSLIANSTETAYSRGSHALKFVDTDSGHPHVYSAESHGNLTVLGDTYVEVALKGVNLSNGVLGNNGVDIYFGSDASNRENWRIPEADFLAGTAKPGGWWILHLALDAGGHSTLTGTTLNDVALTGTAKSAWTSGTVDWSNIGYVAVMISEGSTSSVGTYYLDQVAIGTSSYVPPLLGTIIVIK